MEEVSQNSSRNANMCIILMKSKGKGGYVVNKSNEEKLISKIPMPNI